MEIEVVHRPEDSRYVVLVDGEDAGFALYRAFGRRVTVPYTEVHPRFEGRGVGSALVRGMLEDMRDRGMGIVPTCSFVASYIGHHPEYHGLLVGELRDRFAGAVRATT